MDENKITPVDSPFSSLTEEENLKQEIENLEYLGEGLNLEHQKSLRYEILSHVDNLKIRLKEYES